VLATTSMLALTGAHSETLSFGIGGASCAHWKEDNRTDCNTLASDNERDISVLKPAVTITGTPLSISSREDFTVGTQVSTWGFPGGYFGVSPMLSVGYLSGIDGIRTASGTVIRQWVVNAAFNSGNSGGPLLHIETGEVIGVVSSKLAPINQSGYFDRPWDTKFRVHLQCDAPKRNHDYFHGGAINRQSPQWTATSGTVSYRKGGAYRRSPQLPDQSEDRPLVFLFFAGGFFPAFISTCGFGFIQESEPHIQTYADREFVIEGIIVRG